MNAQPFCLPMDDVTRGDDLCHQLTGLLECMRTASTNVHEQMADDSMGCACWLAVDLVQEIEKIIKKRVAEPEAHDAA